MSPTHPTARTRLSPAVYWRRRLFVVGVLLAIVLIGVNAVRGGADPAPDVRATTASADRAPEGGPGSTVGPDTDGSAQDPAGTKGGKKGGQGGKKASEGGTTDTAPTGPVVALPTAPVLAEPEGVCTEDDIVVTPTVTDAVAGESATIVLALRTVASPACTWTVSPDTLAVKVSVGTDRLWTTQECTDAVPVRQVVVRQAAATTYELTWNTRRSDADCPALTEYAQPGEYRVTAAALGGDEDFVIFDLAAPQAPEPPPVPDAEPLKGKGATNKPTRGVDEAR